jgi:hypothetical protein
MKQVFTLEYDECQFNGYNTIFVFSFLTKELVKTIFGIALLLSTVFSFGQSTEEEKLYAKLVSTTKVPDDLLSTRSAVFYETSFTQTELEEIQKGFQQTGIDAVIYFETLQAMAGSDPRLAHSRYLTTRAIRFLIFLRKTDKDYEFSFTTFNGKNDFVEQKQEAWQIKSSNLSDLLRSIFRACINSQKKQNFLINDYPEREVTVKAIVGKRLESLAKDINYFKVAIPKFGDEEADRQLQQYFKDNFPIKYEIVEPLVDEKELRNKGFLYILRYVHTQGARAKEILGYEESKSETAIATIKYVNNEIQLKTIPSETLIFKFYFKNMEFDNVHLGSKWDADLTWQEALANHIQAYRQEVKIP